MKTNFNKGILTTILFLLTVSLVKAETITFYHVDLLGSPVAESNMNGEIQWSQDYRPYGERAVSSAQTSVNEMWYTGKQHDNDTGLTYMQNRYYDPSIGRFMAMDPLPFRESNVSSFGPYVYVGNNPYRYTDPDGQDSYDIHQALRNNGHRVPEGPQMTDAQARLLASFMIPGMGFYEAYDDFQKGNYFWASIGVISEVPFIKWIKGAKGAKATKMTKASCCFVAGTKVLTESGYKSIEEVKLGENLWAKNVDTGEEEWKPVTRVFVENDREIYKVKVISAAGEKQNIEATDDHPFYVVDKGWKKTIELESGDLLESNLGKPLTVESVIFENRKDVTYNFTVADFHTYYVTRRNILVHNCLRLADEILSTPQSLWGKSAGDIQKIFTDAGFDAAVSQSKRKGSSKLAKVVKIKGHPEIQQIMVHPGGGRHIGAYYKISTSTKGKIKVVDPKTYKADANDKSKIIEMAVNVKEFGQ